MCVYHCAQLSYTAQSSSDYIPSYPPDRHQSSDAVYWRRVGYPLVSTHDCVICYFSAISHQRQQRKHSGNISTGVASYGALGQVPLLDLQHCFQCTLTYTKSDSDIMLTIAFYKHPVTIVLCYLVL